MPLIQADALRIPLADGSVHCCITSPPYYALRDYGVAGQLGLEETPGEYVENMVAVFREVWRVLRPDATCWLNLGDSYGTNGRGTGGNRVETSPKQLTNRGSYFDVDKSKRIERGNGRWGGGGNHGKQMLGIPWRVAFALQSDGWYLRSDIIWSKPNPMPESVTDRPTKAHEYLFLLAKRERYFYDAEAVKEPAQEWSGQAARFERTGPVSEHVIPGQSAAQHRPIRKSAHMEGTQRNDGDRWRTADGGVAPRGTRNRRSVWEIATAPFAGAHFATFPPALVEPCILAGTSAAGVCAECGAPWERVVERDRSYDHVTTAAGKSKIGPYASQTGDGEGTHDIRHGVYSNVTTTGWAASCNCAAPSVPATVLDPFAGSGTTGEVARLHGRRFVGLDINGKYLRELALPRAEGTQTAASLATLPMFAAKPAQ